MKHEGLIEFAYVADVNQLIDVVSWPVVLTPGWRCGSHDDRSNIT